MGYIAPSDHDQRDTGDRAFDELRPPLPEERYPRRFDDERKPGKGYYIAQALVMGVYMITPLSCAYLVWFILLRQRFAGGLTATLFAAYAFTEIVFSLYYSYLTHLVQASSPASTLPLETRNQLFKRVMLSDLKAPVPLQPSANAKLEEKNLYHLYSIGHIDASQYHHEKDQVYEEGHGIRQRRRRVGKMTEEDRDIISAFVEEDQGDREERLIKEIEGGLGQGHDDWNPDGVLDREGNFIKLHRMDRRAVEFRERLRTWFNHAPWDSIKKENMLIWLAWSCFNLPYEEVQANPEWMSFLNTTLELLQARTGTTFQEGLDTKVNIIRLTLDPVNAKGRPLILYALSSAINGWLIHGLYPYQGMGLYKEGNIDYLIRIPLGWTPEKGRSDPDAMPVVYFHGLGFGLLQSYLLTKHLIKSLPSHPLFIPLFPHTAQSFFHPRHLRPFTRQEVVDGVKAICKKWGFWDGSSRGGGISLLSHSNGSVAHGWILKDCPSLVKRNTFVDPVVFCLWEGDVCHSFCYRKPTTALELLLWYFIASEIGIANYISRHFDWADNMLFVDQIPNATNPSKTAFFLGGKDIIIDSQRVRRYLERQGAAGSIHWDDNAGHGDGLAGSARDRVVMFAGTGTVAAWNARVKSGSRVHQLGQTEIRRFPGFD